MKPTAILLLFQLSAFVGCKGVLKDSTKPAIVLITDFGLKDGAVAAMKGVIRTVDPGLDIFDLTHEIPPYHIWEAAYRLDQTAAYWPKGTIFVSVVDPGVGTARRSVVLRTRSGHYFVSPDNGSLGLVAASLGVAELRQIDEAINRRTSSGASYTFHGRDVYAFTAGRLASGLIRYEEVGSRLGDSVSTILYQKAVRSGVTIRGMIPILDIQYGNVWTNIPDSMVLARGVNYGDSLDVSILHRGTLHFHKKMPLVKTFGEVPKGNAMAYFNSLMQLSFALNMSSLAGTYGISSGPDWTVELVY